MSAADPITQLQDGLVRAADTAASVQALTYRADGNLLPWVADIPARLPVATYLISTLAERVGGYTATVQISAWAMDAAVAQQLLGAVLGAFAQPLLEAAGCDAVVLSEIRREIPSEDREDPSRADADLTLWFTPA